MNTPTMTMTPAEAQAKLLAYRKQLHRKADAEFEAAAKGYEAMVKGLRLLDINLAFVDVPLDAKQRPRLAIGRADRKQVRLRDGTGFYQFSTTQQRARATWQDLPDGDTLNIRIPRTSRPSCHDGYALVPMVPADALETAGNPDLSKCHILWEVEQWADRRIGSAPDKDPYLLRHLHGSLYVVLAEWDLTELERAVMSGRRDTR